MNSIIQFIENYKIKSVLDIGANLGDWANTIKIYVPNIKLLSIEANPACEKFLKDKNLNYIICCLSDRVKLINFYIDINSEISTGCSYYLEKTDHFKEKQFISLTTNKLDDIVTDVFDYIKIDTQGSELDIILGGINVVSKCKFLQLELSLIEYNENSPTKEKVIQFMNSIGFVPVAKIEEHYMNGKIIQEDFIFQNQNLKM